MNEGNQNRAWHSAWGWGVADQAHMTIMHGGQVPERFICFPRVSALWGARLPPEPLLLSSLQSRAAWGPSAQGAA